MSAITRELAEFVAGTSCDALPVEVRERVKSLKDANHFDALGVHWSANSDEIAERHERLQAEHAEGEEADRIAPRACARIRARAHRAYECLRDERRRTAYRRQTYQELDFEAASEIVEQHGKSQELRGLDREARRSHDRAKELHRSVERRAPTVSEEALNEAVRRQERKSGKGEER